MVAIAALLRPVSTIIMQGCGAYQKVMPQLPKAGLASSTLSLPKVDDRGTCNDKVPPTSKPDDVEHAERRENSRFETQ